MHLRKIVLLILGLACSLLVLCESDRDDNEALRARLAQHEGVWEGTYTYLTPRGDLVDQHGSRQETRIEGGAWNQHVNYQWPDGRRASFDFHARLEGDRLVYDDQAFEGVFEPVNDRVALVTGSWNDHPGRTLVETITTVADGHQARTWQVFEDDALVLLVTIEEHRVKR
jgi:hypothetical protein